MKTPLKIDVWSDIACPFCFIGKHKLEKGAAEAELPIQIEYHSYVLAPNASQGAPGSHAQLLAKKYNVSEEEARVMEERSRLMAETENLSIDYSRLIPTPMFKAHQLLHLAKSKGKQVEMKERLLRAYFSEGKNVGSIQELAQLGAEVGLDEAAIIQALEADEFLPAVEADLELARQNGIRSVPFFVVNGKYAIQGAQDASTFAQALQKISEEASGES